MYKSIKRGSIWIVDFDPTAGHEQKGQRPAVVMSSSDMDVNLIELAFVVPGTSTDRNLPNHVMVKPSSENQLTNTTYFMAEQTRSVSLSRFAKQLGTLEAQQMFELEELLIILLDLGAK